MKLSGKCQSKDGYSRAYIGKPGLTAQLLSVLEGVEFTRGIISVSACSRRYVSAQD